MENEKICNFCRTQINLETDKHVLLGTYQGKNILEETYFHFQCFQKWYNSKIIEKTKNTIKDATKKVAGMLGGLKRVAVAQGSGEEEDYIDFSAEIPDMKAEIPEIDLNVMSDPVKYDKKKNGRRKRNLNIFKY